MESKALNQLISEARELLQLEFGVQPEKSEVRYYNIKDWKRLVKEKNINGFFQPRILTAHINSEPSDTLLSRAIHEYLGHGSYCEYARNGKIIVRFEQELGELEEKLIGKRLPQNLRVGIRRGKRKSLVRSQNPNFDYLFYVNKDSPFLQEYIILQKTYKQFFQENLLTYEGFAVWLEKFLLERLKQESIWSIRKKEIEGTDYQKFYQEFGEFERKNGILSLIYQVGFPKQFDKESIKRVASEHLDLNKLSLLILYGSKRDYGDIDLLAVTKDKTENKQYPRDLDITKITEQDFINRLSLLDISLTEPLLTGELIIGNKNELEEIKRKLCKQKFSKEAELYLKRKSSEAWEYANYCYQRGVKQNSNSEWFLYALHNLSYVWSYTLSNKMYSKGHKIVRLENILELEESSTLNQIFNYTKSLEHSFGIPQKDIVKKFLDKTKHILH